MENATGKSTAELRKMMEMGQLGVDVLPAFGKALRDLANQGGALEKVMNSARVTQNRFVTQAQKASDTIFQAGFGEGISDMFQTFTDLLMDSQEGLVGLGKTFKSIFNAISSLSRVVTPVLNEMFRVMGDTSQALDQLFGENGRTLITGFAAVVVAAMSPVLLTLAAIIALMDEITALFIKGKIGLIEKAIGQDLSLGEGTGNIGAGFRALPGPFGGLSGELLSGLNATPLAQTVNATASKTPTVITNQITVHEDGSGTSRQIIQETLGMGMTLPQ